MQTGNWEDSLVASCRISIWLQEDLKRHEVVGDGVSGDGCIEMDRLIGNRSKDRQISI